ncbi:hypothetical protein SNEBB_004145 [Seison nebaliae]|nr:hypothetical protein SNEBB_004145 [Seison nebaliae]
MEDFEEIGAPSTYITLERINVLRETAKNINLMNLCRQLYAKKPYGIASPYGYSCQKVAPDEYRIFKSRILSRMEAVANEPVSNKWKDDTNFHLQSMYKSQPTLFKALMLRVDYFNENYEITLSMTFKPENRFAKETWFTISNLDHIVGPLDEGATPYDVNEIKKLSLSQESFYKLESNDITMDRYTGMVGRFCGCECDEYLVGIVGRDDVCKDVYSVGRYWTNYNILYSKGPTTSSHS